MQRDLKLVRLIIIALEDEDVVDGRQGYSEEQISYHGRLLHEGGLVRVNQQRRAIDGQVETAMDGLTWHGHDFAGLIRDESRYWRGIEKCRKATGGVAIPMLMRTLVELSVTDNQTTTGFEALQQGT